MRILFRNDWCVFVATTKSEGDFLRPNRKLDEKDEDFEIRQQAYAKRLRQAMAGLDLRPATIHAPRICHGAKVVRSSKNADEFPASADGIATNELNAAFMVTGADCPPILILDPKTRAMALCHSGRESTRQNIAANAVRLLVDQFSATADRLIAVIGPGICGHCYEVNAEIAGQFAGYALAIHHHEPGKASYYLDLPAVIGQQLETAGIAKANINQIQECTYENRDLWFSCRRDKHNGLKLDEPRLQAFMAMRTT